MGKQLSPEQRARALGLLDAGTSQQVVARRFGVHRATIRRLQKRDSGGDPVWRRKSGTGMKKSYGIKEISAVRKAIEKNPFMTSYQIKAAPEESTQEHFTKDNSKNPPRRSGSPCHCC